MKKLNTATASRSLLGKVSISTLGDVNGVLEVAGLYIPSVRLS
ncbi:MAG TPA: hypothetical protein VNR86_05320 [Sphingomicrobium sp.]|nr:hypothetical protein [Sphingomicrobium sp.]